MPPYQGGGEMIHAFHERFGVMKQAVSQRYWAERVIGYATTKEEMISGR